MDVFRALADDTRRGLLDSLFHTDGQTVGQLCEQFPALTRFAVMKHLGILEDTGLVTTLREGRSKRHFLNPIPIAEIAERWISKFAAPHATALVGLKADLEKETR